MSEQEEIRELLERTREDYRELVAGLSAADWRRKAPGQSWTNGQLCFHIAGGVGMISQSANRLRGNKGVNPPAPLMPLLNLASAAVVRLMSRSATPDSVRKTYEDGHQRALAVLEQVQDNEWRNGAMHLGRQTTVEDSFRYIREHFEEHRATIQRASN